MAGLLKRLLGGADAPAAEPEAPAPAPSRRPVEVGWLIDTDKARFIWGEPKRVRTIDPNARHAKSVSNCPAFLDYEAHMFEVPCPIDARLGIKIDEKGAAALVNLDGESSGIRNSHLSKMFSINSKNEWRHPNRPIIQFITPYIFIADEPVFMTQMPPVQHYHPEPWPGILIGGRLPIHIWPRVMMWAFEWWDISKPLVFKRGDPWFYLGFETTDPTRSIRMVEAEMTPDLREHIQGAAAVTNYVNQTFQLFKVAEARRPAKLIQRKLRGSEPAAEAE